MFLLSFLFSHSDVIGSRRGRCFWCFGGDDFGNASWIGLPEFTFRKQHLDIYYAWAGSMLQLLGLPLRVVVNKACITFGMCRALLFLVYIPLWELNLQVKWWVVFFIVFSLLGYPWMQVFDTAAEEKQWVVKREIS